jgi:hypothetical protein
MPLRHQLPMPLPPPQPPFSSRVAADLCHLHAHTHGVFPGATGVEGASGPPVMPVVAARASLRPGQLLFDRPTDTLWVRCVDAWAQVTGVAIPARKHLTITDFANGFLSSPPARGGPHVFVYVADE